MKKIRTPGPLFDDPPTNGTATSKAAADSIKSKTPSIRSAVLSLVEDAGFEGATCDEIEARLSLKHQTASARLYELRKQGLIVDSGIRRKTRSGSPARVYVASGVA